MEQVEHLPLPYFKINERYEILLTSEKAKQTFLIGEGFLSIVDEGSQTKVRKGIVPEKASARMELILKTKSDPMVTFQIDINWINKEAHIICTEMTNQYDQVSGQLLDLRNRLADTDFALLEKKEELEKAIERTNQLSGPFIPLSDEVAVVPLFGDLFPDKLSIITQQIVHSLYNTDYQWILFDFTAVAEIDVKGIQSVEELFKTIHLMGQEAVICGIKPEHAQLISNFQWFLQTRKLNSLSEAVRRYIKIDIKKTPVS